MKAFVSHSTVDKEFVENHIVDFLEQNGVATWYSSDNIDSATEWEKKTRQALKECDWFLVVLTPNSVASPWVQAEVHWAMDHRRDQVVPVLAESCAWQDLHLMLRTRQLVFLNENLEEGKSKLLAIWEKQLRPVVHQKLHNRLINEPILGVEDYCVSTMAFDLIAYGPTRAVSLTKRTSVSLPKSIKKVETSEIACIQSCVSGMYYLFRSGELFRLRIGISDSEGIKPIGVSWEKYELPAAASSTCLVIGSLKQRASRYRLIGCADGSLCAFAPYETTTQTQLIAHNSKLSVLASSTKSVFASGDVEGNVTIWSQSTLQQLASAQLHGQIYSFINDPNNGQFIVAVGDGEICAIDYHGHVSTRIKITNRPITHLIFANKRLILFSAGESLGLWDVNKQQIVGNYKLESKTTSNFIRREDQFSNAFFIGCDDGSLIELTILDPKSHRNRALF